MPVVVGVQFRPVTKVYHFSPHGQLDLMRDDYVVVQTSKGQEVAQIVEPPHTISDSDVVGEMQRVLRRATPWDMVQKDMWAHKQQEALALCRHKAREHKLDIKIVRCEYNYTGGRLLIYFSSEGRIDFRTLVRELAKIFRTRIEMRQIGVRDEAKLLDGVGKCGRQLCCTSWLREFTPVSIRMAKNQQLPLNPDEISGVCGRLLCCLSYEDAYYKEQNKKMPKIGATVTTPQGQGRVRHVHPIKESVTVMLESDVLTEFLVQDLLTNKTQNGDGCSTCGGCTTKRRASAEEDNERYRRNRDAARASSREGYGADERDDGSRGRGERRQDERRQDERRRDESRREGERRQRRERMASRRSGSGRDSDRRESDRRESDRRESDRWDGDRRDSRRRDSDRHDSRGDNRRSSERRSGPRRSRRSPRNRDDE